MRKSAPIIILLLFCLMLSACSQQRSVDIYEFSHRLFKAEGNELYEPSSYYFDGEYGYSYFLSINDTRNAVLTLTTDEDLSVNSFDITVTKAGQPLTDGEREFLFKLFVCACSVLEQSDLELVSNELASNGFSAEIIDFTSYNLEIENEKQSFFIYSNSEIISLYFELI